MVYRSSSRQPGPLNREALAQKKKKKKKKKKTNKLIMGELNTLNRIIFTILAFEKLRQEDPRPVWTT